MRKRSKYKPKPVLFDPVGYVIAGIQPVSAARESMTLLGAKNHGAIEAIRTGHATKDQVNFLVNAFNISMALAHMGQGEDWIPELKAAQDAIKAAAARPKFLFTGPELTAVNTGIMVHDAQMSDPCTTVQMLERAVAGLKKLESRGQAVRFNFEQEPLVPAGYTAEELDRDNPHNQWMYET